MAENNVPFSYETQQGVLKRRQSYIDRMAEELMRQQSPKFLQNSVATHYAGPGIGDAIGKVLSAYFLDKQQKGVDEESSALTDRYNTELKTALEQYNTTRNGREAVMYPGSAGEPNPASAPMVEGIPAQPGDPRKAAIEAIVSSFAPLREVGMADLKASQKEGLTPKDLLPYVNPASIPQLLTNGLSGFQPKNDLGEVGGTIYDKNTRNVVTLNGPKPELVTQNGDLYESSPSTNSLRKLDNAPKITIGGTKVAVNAGQKKGSEAYFNHAASQVDALGKQANSSQSLLATLDSLEQLHKAGINSNITTGMATAMQNLGQSLGVKVDANRLGNTETYNALITDLWQRAVSQYGGNRGVTKEEAEEIKKLTPLASSSPQAREQLFRLYRNSAARTIGAYKQANKSFAEATAADDPRLFAIPDMMQDVYVPPAGNGGGGGAKGGQPSVSNW